MDLRFFENLTPPNKAVQSLRELLTLTAFVDEDLERFFTFRGNVENGKKLGWIGEMEDVGWTGTGCNPDYRKVKIQAAEKEWKLGEWEVPLEWCYQELYDTIAEYTLKKGTDIGDLTSTEYMDDIVLPALELAMRRMMWRFIWFGNTGAENISAGGVITDGVDTDLFKPIDGFFKQLFAVTAADPTQRVVIAANNEATYQAQRDAIRQPGVAMGIFDDLRDNADPRISTLDGVGMFVTKSLGDALARDVKREYKDIITWEQVFNGLEVANYDGTPIFKISIWDRYIQKYENNGTKLNLPFRAVYGTPKQLLVGSPANKPISDLDIWFDRKERMNYIYSTGRLGALIGEDDLFQLAY